MLKENAEMPELNTVRDLLGGLLGRRVRVESQRGNSRLRDKNLVVALYRQRRTNQVTAMCAADLSFACSTGAALTMIPAKVAQRAAKDNDITPVIEENIWEIFNILSRTFEGSLGSCVLEKIYYPGDDLPQTVTTVLRAGNGQVNRVAMDIEVNGYDAGVLMALTT